MSARFMTDDERKAQQFSDLQRASNLGCTLDMLKAIDGLAFEIHEIGRKLDKFIAICTGQGDRL
jgi:hypothetical protein